MRTFNRFLLAGTSHLAILMMGAGGAWAQWTIEGAPTNDAAAYVNSGIIHSNVDAAHSTGIIDSGGTVSLKNNGQISGVTPGNGNNAALVLSGGSGSSNLNVDNRGSVLGSSSIEADAIFIGNPTEGGARISITNSGNIISQRSGAPWGSAITISSGDRPTDLTITNNSGGLIKSYSGVAIGLASASSGGRTTIIVNGGTIESVGNHSAIALDSTSDGIPSDSVEHITINGGNILNSTTTGHPVIAMQGTDDSRLTITGGNIAGNVWVATNNKTSLIFGANDKAASFVTGGNFGAGDNALRNVTFQNSGSYVTVGHKIYSIGDIVFSGGTVRLDSDLTEPLSDNGTSLDLRGQHYNIMPTGGNIVLSGGTIDLNTRILGAQRPGGYEGGLSLTADSVIKTTIGPSYNGYIHLGIYDAPFTRTAGTLSIVPTVVGKVVRAGDKFLIIDHNGGSAGTLSAANISVVSSGAITWTPNVATETLTDGYGNTSIGNKDVYITVASARNYLQPATASATNTTSLDALTNYTGNDQGLNALGAAVQNLSSAAEVRKAGAQLRPESTGNTAQASMGAVTQALSTIQVRTDAVRVAASETGTGVSSGETLKGLGVWGQGFGSTASQSERNDVSGYDADTYGLAFGADFKVIDPLRVGLSFAYAKTNVDSTGDRSGSGQDIDSYITSLYGTYSGKGWYVDGALTYGIHKYDATRHVAIAGAAAQNLKADYSGRQMGAKAEVGVPLAVGTAVVTPLASLAYNNLKQDSYSETGGAAALEVGSSSTDSIRSGLGAKVSAKVATIGNWEISPNARAVWHHEFNRSSQDQTSAYVAGGSSFTTPGTDIATEHFNLGLGVDVASVRNTTISAKYDADLADKYVSHSASLQLRTEF